MLWLSSQAAEQPRSHGFAGTPERSSNALGVSLIHLQLANCSDYFGRLLKRRNMAGARNHHHLGIRDTQLERPRVHRRNQLVAFAPNQNGLRFYPVEPRCETALGNWEQDLPRRAQLPRVLDQKILQKLWIAHVGARA